MLVRICIDKFSPFPAPYEPAILWGITILTVFILIGLRLFFRYKTTQIGEHIQG
jgi:hypothetical protein